MKVKITTKKVVITIISLFFLFNWFEQINTVNNISDSLSEKSQELIDIQEENKRLQAELDRANSDYEYLESLARERLGVIKDGEEIILPIQIQE